MAGKWEISEAGASELDSLAAKLESSCQDLENANNKIAQVIQENPAIGPHKKEIEDCINTIEKASKDAKEDTELLAGRIRSTAARIRNLVHKKMIRLGKL